VPDPRPLTDRQQAFVEEYLVDLNATQAAIRAGYSARRAAEIGYQLLQKTPVSEAVARAKAERSARTGITADRVLEELGALAFANMGQFAEWGPGGVTFRPSDGVDPRAVAEVKESVNRYGSNLGIKLHDKVAALKLAGQHVGLFGDRTDDSSPPVKGYDKDDLDRVP
jgi:phage terminase small subunit